MQDETQDHDLLEHGVLHSAEDQHRCPPPLVGQPLRGHVEIDAGVVGDQVPDQAGAPDQRGERGAPAEVTPGLRGIDTDHAQALTGALQQISDEPDDDERETDPEQLQGEVEQGPRGR